MLEPVVTVAKALEDYRPIVGDEPIQELRALAEPLRGARVLNINATPFGGGVAEMLSALVPLMNDVGLAAEWRVITGSVEFFSVTKAMHNSLQGMAIDWTADMERTWLIYNDINAELFAESYDFVIVHDPQPAGLLEGVLRRNGHRPAGTWLWRCHLDTSNARPEVWDFILPFVRLYQGAIFTRKEYVNGDLSGGPPVFTILPAIDPLSSKNRKVSPDIVKGVLLQCGIDPTRPIVCQVSRFDPWKDPLGVIDVYREVKEEVPELQLVIAGVMANDDPEGWEYCQRTLHYAGEDEDIHVLSNLSEIAVGAFEVGALQQAASVVIQKSIREGFGLTVAEAMWKGTPVVGGNCGGIRLQIRDGDTGFLVSSPEDCAARIITLLQNPDLAKRMGRAGRESVRRKFLIPRLLRDHLSLYASLVAEKADFGASVPAHDKERLTLAIS
ncbi:MAG: glycosyltransferase [Dehalococcoidia bacterium]|nr:glycosyltransferase [Dehalococcoidia bacterium]